ncbi:MAG: hypothetical protein ACTHL8_05085 [Burkholderiaceae bacterium]
MSTSPEPADTSPAAPPPPWLSTQHEMEEAARPVRTRLARVRMRPGVYRIAQATCLHAVVQSTTDARREHLYRVTLEWLAEFDTQTGRAEKLADRATPGRTTNTLQLRVLEQPGADGRMVALARLGPRGQIAAEPKGHGIMSFLRGVLVEWAAAAHPQAAVVPDTFVHDPARGDNERQQREQFFVRSGFVVTGDATGGRFGIGALRDLRTSWNTDKVLEITPALVAEAFGGQALAGALKRQVEALEAQIDGLARDRRAAEVMSRIWLAVTVLAVVFGIVFGIQPRVA